ncbi:hypothetical protein [Actinomyces procaprae]|uniref:hypothetical protein n=1 Tax=Actinomyces procaprae TaxID=2560010 RepID=UPI0010A21C92|nr:hypothetical protein [Actinomyces procaprae]
MIGTVDVDWSVVLQAVRYAIDKCCKLGAEAIRQKSVEVELPMPLRQVEYDLVDSWVGADMPVTYCYEDDEIVDGRHRLWLTRPYAAGDGLVPLIAENLWYLDDVFTGRADAAVCLESLDSARLWWDSADGTLRRSNSYHCRQLADAYAELTVPEPVPAYWFQYLHDWDDALPRLAELHLAHRTDQNLLGYALPSAWRFRQDRYGLDPQLVIDMFRTMAGLNGFTMWGEPAPRPRGRLTLFRGATSANRCGPSWTVDPSVARYFANSRQSPGAMATVWVAQIPADRLLAYFPDEREFIVDLTGADHLVHPAPPSARSHWLTRWRSQRLRRFEGRGA